MKMKMKIIMTMLMILSSIDIEVIRTVFIFIFFEYFHMQKSIQVTFNKIFLKAKKHLSNIHSNKYRLKSI